MVGAIRVCPCASWGDGALGLWQHVRGEFAEQVYGGLCDGRQLHVDIGRRRRQHLHFI